MKYSRVILVIAWIGLTFTSVMTMADPITSANVYTLRDNEGASPVGTGQGDNFSIGVIGVSPSAAEGTIGRAINLDTLDELTLWDGVAQGRPGLIGIDLPFDQAIANGWLTPWEIILTNGVDTRSEFTFDRTGVPKMEFVNNLAISGPATAPTVTWQLPTTGPTVNALAYEVWDVDSGVILTPGQLGLPAATEALVLNNVTLDIGSNYAVRIIPTNRDGGNRIVTRSSNWIGWTATSGQAEGEVLELVTGSPVGVSQVVDTPASTFVVEFDYSFATATGDLEVLIDGNKIGTTLTAPATIANEFYHAVFEVEDASLLGLTSATFLIQLDGPTGSTVLVDNIVLAGLVNGDFSSGVVEWTPTGSGSVATAPAATPCGTTLTKNTKLDADMNCPGTALRLTGNKSKKVTLDCAGHSITTIDGTAIIASDVSGVTIKNCSISTNTYFSHGILLTGTTKSTVKDNTIMTSGDSSRGVSLQDSRNNKITGNTVHTTSDFAHGILARAGSNNNLVKNNTLETYIDYPVNIQSSSSNKIYDNTLMSPNGYVLSRSFSLQTGGLGVDTSGNIYAIENNWGGSAGIGTATAFFMVDPMTGLGNSVLPVTKGGNNIGFGFDALDVLPDGTILALPGCCQGSPALYEINPISGNATTIPLNILSGSGKLNGLEATSNTSLLATTNTGGLLNIDLNTGIVTEVGQQSTGWTDVAVHPTNGKVYTVSRRRDEASNTAHLYEINPNTGQIILPEIGDTGEVGLSSIDFALDGTLYGNADGVLIEINPADASVTSVNTGGFGPDPLEPMPKKNKLKGNLFQTADGSLRYPDTITLPTAIEIDISSARVDIGPNRVMVDSAALPFLDENARITLNNITGTYHNLLVDEEDDTTFDPCMSPQCKFVSINGGTLEFDVNGFTSYSSEENTDPTFEFIATVILAEINALKNDPTVSKSARKKLKAAAKKLAKALKFLKNPNFKNVKKALSQIEKTAKDLVKATKKAPAATVPLDRLVNATGAEAQDAIDVAITAGGSTGFIAQAQVHMAKAEELIGLDKLDKAVEIYILAWIAAQIAVQDTEVSQIQFADSNLKACVEALAITRPTDITNLSCTEMGIVDLTGIEKLPNLVSLNLSYNQISDISQLATLTKLVVLSLGDQTASNNLLNTSPANNISNLAPLSSLTKLTGLKLNKNDITDLGPLSMLTQLGHLELSGNGIIDLVPLSSLTKLRHLSLGYTAMGGNQISDLVPISALTKLNILYLNSNLISDITPLSSLVNLVDLRLSDNNISDISTLSSLTNLTTLSLGERFHGGNNIVDLTPLASLTKLNLLFLSNNNISDIAALNALVNLASLSLVGNNISDISALASLTKLTFLSLGEHRFGGNNVSDLSPLAALTELTSLDLDDNNITNISSLASLTKLQWLSMSGNNISNLNAIGTLTEIVNLFLDDNAISDIGPLSSLTKVSFLNLGGTISGNNISSLAPLSSMINLRDLRLDNNNIGDLTPLAGLIKLTSLDLGNNAITAINPLASLTNLSWLNLGKNNIGNVSPLTSLTKLGTLSLDGNNISDASLLSALSNLNWLGLGDNLITDVSALASLTNLSTLTLYDNNINAGVADLVSLTRLDRLDLQRNNNILCTDLATLIGVLGAGVVMEPALCI